MNMDPIGIAVPFFLLLLVLEAWVLHRQGRPLRLNDSLTDIACGIGDQLLGVFVKGSLVIPYIAIQQSFGLFQLPTEAVHTWVIGMLGTDFLYYLFHRCSHRSNLFWATHVVHHQSEEYNLCVALRQPWFAKFQGWLFYLPLALLGVPAEVHVTCFALNLIYQFWIHTETIGKLGPLEWILNTPSHHRVHHGTNPEYLDKNYAGILIIWDRLFGTFQEEQEAVTYGILKPVRSWNPLWVNIQPWMALARSAAAETQWRHKLQAWLKPPAWSGGAETPPEDLRSEEGRGYDEDHAGGLHGYLMVNMVLAGLGMGFLLSFGHSVPTATAWMMAALVVWTILAWGGLFEGRAWARSVEALRVLAIAGLSLAALV